MTGTMTEPTTAEPEQRSLLQTLLGRISRLEIVAAAVIAVVMLVLVVIEPNILEAPFENARTLLFTFGGTVLAGLAFVGMLWGRVPPIARILVLGIPFVLVNWWLLSPYFVDDVVDEAFSVSIASQLDAGTAADAPTGAASTGSEPAADAAQNAAASDATAETPTDTAETASGDEGDEAMVDDQADGGAASDDVSAEPDPVAAEPTPVPTAEPTPSGPVLLGAGQFIGLAGHDGTGDTGLFRNPDGSLLLRFENFDIENGPDLEVYLVPGADQVSLPEGSIHLGPLKGNIGDQNYVLPDGTELAPGPYTVLVWCEAFSVEFVGATINV